MSTLGSISQLRITSSYSFPFGLEIAMLSENTALIGFWWLLELYVITFKVIKGWRATCNNAHSCRCCFPTGRLGHKYQHLISHSFTLSWHWSNKSSPYPNNAEPMAKKWQVSIFKSLVCLDQGLMQPHFNSVLLQYLFITSVSLWLS